MQWYWFVLIGGLFAPIVVKPEYLADVRRRYGLAAAARAWFAYVLILTPFIGVAFWAARTLQLLP